MTDQPVSPGDPRVYLAVERTLLAWVRTGLAMMGFGFVVARFGLFLREMAEARGIEPVQRLGSSLWIGTGLVLLGVVTTLLAALGYWRSIDRLDRNQHLQFKKVSLAVVTAMVLALLGLGMAAYLAFGITDKPA